MQILIIGGVLVVFGLLALFSVSIKESFDITLKMVAKGSAEFPSNYFYFFRQLRNIGLGLVLAFLVARLPLKFFQNTRNALIIFGSTLIFQLLVFSPLGSTFNGAKGWINIAGLGTLQPSEFFKLGFVIFLASRLVRKKKEINSQQFFIRFLVVNALLLILFAFIPDFGTVLILGIVSLILCRYAGARIKYILSIVGIGLVAAVVVGLNVHYIRNRLFYFLDTSVDPNNRSIGWQTYQATVAVGGGGFRGKGYGKGLQKMGYIPEAQSDFVFAAYSEEIGFVGNVFLLGLYLALAFYFLLHLPKVRDEYLRLFGVGIISLIIVQAFVNMGVNLRMLPNTGLTLPFVSFGGTAMMVNLVEIVLLYKILHGKTT